jgi:uncharacterized protein
MGSAALMLNRVSLIPLVEDGRTATLPPALAAAALSQAIPVRLRAGPAERAMLAARIDDAVAQADRAVMFVAEGAACLAAAWWGRLSPRSYVERVAGAFMIAPQPTGGRSPYASPTSPLPFPSLVVGADDAAQQLAAEWGSRLVDGPLAVPQVQPSRRFQSIIARFTAAVVERDVRTAERLLAAIGDR